MTEANPESGIPSPEPRIPSPVLVIGAGSWGTALAFVLARNNVQVYLSDAFTDHIHALKRDRCNNRHLPGIAFPENLEPVLELIPDQVQIEDIVIVVPCEALRVVLKQLKDSGLKQMRLCLASKGLEPTTLDLNHQIVDEVLGDVRTAILSGPSFAGEVAAGQPTAVTIASSDLDTANRFSDLFNNETFRTYTHDDVIGVQVGGAIKNVMAIAAGIADGLGFGTNARAALITRGLMEIMRLGVAMGGRQETFMGLSGLGDLVLTCTDNQSRNRRFGLALAKGQSAEEARASIGQAVEGLRTADAVVKLAAHYNIEMPISTQVQRIILSEINARDAVHELLSRKPGAELE